MDTTPTAKEKWHIGKEIPATFIIVLALQTVGIAIWFGVVWSELMSQGRMLSEIRAERYTKEDARRDHEFFDLRVDAALALSGQRYDAIEARLDRIQKALERHTEAHTAR